MSETREEFIERATGAIGDRCNPYMVPHGPDDYSGNIGYT